MSDLTLQQKIDARQGAERVTALCAFLGDEAGDPVMQSVVLRTLMDLLPGMTASVEARKAGVHLQEGQVATVTIEMEATGDEQLQGMQLLDPLVRWLAHPHRSAEARIAVARNVFTAAASLASPAVITAKQYPTTTRPATSPRSN